MILDNLQNFEQYCELNKYFRKGFEFIKKVADENLPVGKYEIDGKNLYAIVSEYSSKAEGEGKFEGHQKYIDIQSVISGFETIDVIDISKISPKTDYNEEKDVQFYQDNEDAVKCLMTAGDYAVVFPNDIHRPGMAYKGESVPVKKIVVKVIL